MRTTILSALVMAAAFYAAGCSTTAPLTQPASMVGVPVKTLLDAAARDGLRTTFFTQAGEPTDAMPTHGGSVSIFNATHSGQDNYSFDAAGRVLKHMRSAGTNYMEGVWVQVP
jgi:hypothetical protein